MPRLNVRSKDRIPASAVARLAYPSKATVYYRRLWLELKRQRFELLHTTVRDLLQGVDPTLRSDLVDQASVDQEQELSLLVNQRTRHKLHQIDVALLRMEQRRYGFCLRCQVEIPLARLRVQPCASYCVPCQAVDESK